MTERQPPPGVHENFVGAADKASISARLLKARDALEGAALTPEQEEAFADALDAASEIVEAVIAHSLTPAPQSHVVGDLDDKTIVKLLRENLSDKDYDRLTYEKSPPMFPQATYDVPTYALRQFVKAVRAALATTEGSSDG